MDIIVPEGVWFAVAIILLLLITTNVALWLAWKHKDNTHRKDLFNSMRMNIGSAWHKEEEQIGELKKRVSDLTAQSQSRDDVE